MGVFFTLFLLFFVPILATSLPVLGQGVVLFDLIHDPPNPLVGFVKGIALGLVIDDLWVVSRPALLDEQFSALRARPDAVPVVAEWNRYST